MMFHTRKGVTRFDRMMMAVTFAEAGERSTALEMAYSRPERKEGTRKRRRAEKRTDNRPVLRT